MQDAYIAYLDNRSKISSASNAIRSFLYSAIRNPVYNWNRKSKTIQEYFERIPLQEIDHVDYNHEIISAELIYDITRIVERLPDSCQHVFKLSYFDGLSYQVISDQLAIFVKRSVVYETGSDTMFR